MALTATAHHRAALRRGRVGAAGAVGSPVLAIAAVGGVDATAESAVWGGAAHQGARSRATDSGFAP